MKKYLILAALSLVVFSGCNDNQTNSVQKAIEATAPAVEKSVSGETYLPSQSKPMSIMGSEAESVMGTNYVLIFDDSGSMDGDKIVGAKQAVNSFLDSISKEDSLSLVTLNSGSFTGNIKGVKSFLKKVSASGGTPLGAALLTAHSFIKTKIIENKGYGNYVIISITDGESSDNVVDPIVNIYKESKADIILKTIGFHISENNPLNSSYTQYFSANSNKDLANILNSIQAESDDFGDISNFN